MLDGMDVEPIASGVCGPSIGSWQLPCRSDYVIKDGKIQWAAQWSDAQILAGRRSEESRRQAHYEALYRERGFWRKIWRWLLQLFGR